MKNLKMMSKLLIMIVIVGLIPLYVSTLFTHHNEKGEIVHAIEDKNAFFATLVSSNLEEYIYECESQAKLAASTINIVTSVRTLKSDTINDVYRDDVALVTGAIYEQFGYYDIYLTDKNGFVVYSYANPSFETQDLSLNPEIMQSITGTPAWSDLSYSEVDGRNIIRFSTPVYNGSSVIGTANIAIDQTSINLLIQNRVESLGQTGDAYLVDATGLLYTDTRLGDYTQNASLTQTISTKAVERLSEEITAGNLDYHYSGTYKDYRGEEVNGNLSVVKMGNQFYGLIIEVDTAESYSVVDTVIIVVYATLTVSALLSVSVAIIMALSITKPLGKLVKSANRLSTYDISEDLPLSLRKRKDEIGTLAKSIQEITDNLRSLLNEINATSSNVAASSEELTASAEQAATASSEVATTIGEIARGANDQADQTTLGADTLSQLSELVKEESLTIERVHSSMGTVQNSVSEGLTIIRDLNEKNKLSSEASLFVQQSVSQTSVSAHKIGEASTLIASIAEQTNLLSLNAAIEAARAGEAGRGFAVVADQIRQLADQSTRSTQTIDTIIKEVLKSIDTAVSKTSEAVSMLEEQTQIVHMTANKFNQISEATQETEKAISIMSENSKRIAENNANVQEIIHTLSAVAEENAASTEEASAAVEEQSAMIQQISGASENLATLAQELSDQIAKFKLS